MKKHNFSAGPCILPQEVLQKASEAVVDFNDSGLSLIEISHRSKPFVDVMLVLLIIFMVDVTTGITDLDDLMARLLRKKR